MPLSLNHYIEKIADGGDLSQEDARGLFTAIMEGEVDQGVIGAVLMGLRRNGETVEVLTGAAQVLRSKVLKVPAPENAIDTCGTGGDAKGTYNISTACAFVIGACGVPVAKHGNRSVSSKSGSSDVLELLGVPLDLTPEQVGQSIKQHNLGFMFAPSHHAAMKHVAPVRKSLGIRTIFNLLGPLANPAGTKRQVLGVYAREWVLPLAHVAQKLGSEHVWVVHGLDGLDEITTTEETFVAELKNGEISSFTVKPEDVGLPRALETELIGGDAQTNAQALHDLLDGKPSAYRDIVVLNAAAGLIVGGLCDDLKRGVALAQAAIDDGHAKKLLDTVRGGAKNG